MEGTYNSHKYNTWPLLSLVNSEGSDDDAEGWIQVDDSSRGIKGTPAVASHVTVVAKSSFPKQLSNSLQVVEYRIIENGLMIF